MRAGILVLAAGICGLQAEDSAGASKVTAVRNQVQKSQTATNLAADVGHEVRSGEKVQTGEQGLVELKGKDNTTVRAGEKSQVSYDAEQRKVKVDKGTVLIHADPKDGPIQIQAGDTVIEVQGKKP